MEVKAKAKYIRISPKKTRLVTNVLKGLGVKQAISQLKFIPRRATKPLLKVLTSALANAKTNFGLKEENLYIKEILVNQGPVLKRWMPKAFGHATPIRKKTSHIEITLSEVSPQKVTLKKRLPEAPVETFPKKEEIPPKTLPQEKTIPSLQKAEIMEPKTAIFDERRKGKRRTKQHIDKTKMKEKGGLLKRIFRRKSI